MNHDLLIKNGMVIDGTGKDRFRGDIAVKAGRIAQIGRVDGAAAKVIDAGGQIVCPGFVDPHTHYDAQITWDRLLSSSAEHGITTVTMGNCGVGIAPCRPAARELLIDDLVTVEGIDKNVLAQGIEWGWETFPQYIDAAEKRGIPSWLDLNRGEFAGTVKTLPVREEITLPIQEQLIVEFYSR